MGGQYRNKKEISKFLTDWYQEAVETESWKRADHFHLSQVSKKFRNPEVWFDAAFDMFKMYFDIIDKSKYTILMRIPLLESGSKTDATLLNNDYIIKEINDFESPSFYLFPVNSDNLAQTANSVLYEDDCFKFYFHEEQDDIDGLYYRSVSVTI
ncbi:MAG: hypothetical protein LBS01_07435 [Prevotellaceae bacterium]|jgi:hypothetical protein|nr:hypothetical protein [Prevotellaceae bacterium]